MFLTLQTIGYSPRAAEDLLSRVHENYQKPQEALELLKEAVSNLLSKHSHEMQAAEGLLRAAEAKAQESTRLLLILGANLREFHVSLTSSGPKWSCVHGPILSFLENEPRELTSCQAPRVGSRLALRSILRGDFCYRTKICVFRRIRT